MRVRAECYSSNQIDLFSGENHAIYNIARTYAPQTMTVTLFNTIILQISGRCSNKYRTVTCIGA